MGARNKGEREFSTRRQGIVTDGGELVRINRHMQRRPALNGNHRLSATVPMRATSSPTAFQQRWRGLAFAVKTRLLIIARILADVSFFSAVGDARLGAAQCQILVLCGRAHGD
ncbi:MAG: hypothetical protein WCJ35_00380 [Planctomycetota bacterium]